MGDAVQDALNRSNAEKSERSNQIINDARSNIQASQIQAGDISSTDAANIARNAQIIEEAKRTIPFETMQHVDTVSPPMNTPPTHGNIKTDEIQLHPDVQAKIESIEQGGGNNYLNQNAVDRALARNEQESPGYDQKEQAIER